MVFFVQKCFPSKKQIASNGSRQKQGIRQIEHAPYSPDLNLSDLFLPLQLRPTLKEKRFDDIPNKQQKVTKLLNKIPKEDFLQSFQDMYNRSQRCIVTGDDYFGG